MMKKKFLLLYVGLASFLLMGLCSSCEDDVEAKAPPTVLYQLESLTVDLNKLAQPAIICVVNSETGLKSIDKFIISRTENGEEYETRVGTQVNSFYNIHSYSINEKPLFTEEMVRFKLVITDLAGQVTVSEYPFTIIPLLGLPEIYFSSDEEGLHPITSIDYIEEDEMPDVYAQVSSEEDLQYVLFYQTVDNMDTQINDTVFFEPGTRKAAVNLSSWDSGDEYVFPVGTTGVKAKAAAGEMKKSREVPLKVNFKELITVNFDQDNEDFNGLAIGSSVTVSGNIESAYPVDAMSYVIYGKDMQALSSGSATIANGMFSFNFTADKSAGSMVVTTTDNRGKSRDKSFTLHVGYKYYYLLSSLSGSVDNNPGTYACFLSAEKGQMYNYCNAKENSEYVDVGFGIWDSNSNIRVNKLTSSDKFRTKTGCSPNNHTDGSARDWPVVNERRLSTFSKPYSSFDLLTVDDIRNEVLGSDAGTSGVKLVNGFRTENPVPQSIAIFVTNIDGEDKRAIVAFDKMQSVDNSIYIYSTFWVKVKVEL